MNARTVPAVKTQALIGVSIFVLALWLAYNLGSKIASDDLRTLEFAGLGIAAFTVAVTILRDWRRGFYMFLVWLLFEDLVRKYLGNNLAIYFGKDVLVGLVYVAFFSQVRKHRVKVFRPQFLIFLYPFAFLAIVGIFNPYSPAILYGLMGLKLYFYYVPLMFVGYALISDDESLRKFLTVNMALSLVIGAVGITQAIVGHSFLNPANLAPELRDLGQMDRVTPISGQVLAVPSSVFVSAGRYDQYLILMFVIALGSAGYILLHTEKSRLLTMTSIGGIVGATAFCGSRGAVAYMIIGGLALAVGFMWGAPWRRRQAHRMLKALRRAVIVSAIAFAAILLLFPDEIAPRIAFYLETLDPSSSAFEVGNRTWSYPISGLLGALEQPTWLTGIGTGTASLGTQYVAKIMKAPQISVWVEEGYGQLILEMGIAAPILWILWTMALLVYCIRIVKSLRQTRFFPIAFAITWYVFLLLFPFTYGAIGAYQNFLSNALMWFFVGILFKLPSLQASAPIAPEVLKKTKTRARRFAFTVANTVPGSTRPWGQLDRS
jgi:hypothetical protein